MLPVVVDDLNCNGSEERLTDCPHNSPSLTSCHDGNDASVVCQPLDGNRNCRICSSCNFYVFTITMKHCIVVYANCSDGELRTDVQEFGENGNENTTTGMLEICSNNVWFSIYYTSSWYRATLPATRSLACHLLGYDARACKYTLIHVKFQVVNVTFPLIR